MSAHGTARMPRANPGTPALALPLPLTHPAALFAALCAGVAIVLSVSFKLSDTDLWHLLVVGKATFALHRIPTTDLWTWAHWGTPQAAPSWPFRALTWLIWDRAGVTGLFAWRWLSTLAAFAFAWAAARRAGARGLIALPVLVWASLVYRGRSEIRPETLAAVLFACQLWILESRRRALGGSGWDRAWWIVPIALVWANVHVTYHVGLALTGAYALAERFDAWQEARTPSERTPRTSASAPPVQSSGAPRTLWIVLALSVAVSLLNPSGARLLVQPFQYFLVWRHEPIYRAIQELQPTSITAHWRSGLPLLIVGWPLLALWRAFARRVDLAELLLCAGLTALALSSQRFLGLYALAAAVFVARDLQAALPSLRRPSALARPWVRGAIAGVAALAIGVPEWTRLDGPLGVGFLPASFPAAACDFIARNDVRGRAFNHFHLGSYLAFRFWPERDRLPFMTTQPENSPPEDRAGYFQAISEPAGFAALDARYHFDYLLLSRPQSPGEVLQQVIEADSSWAMVFLDDAAEVFVRRAGPLAPVAAAHAYRLIPASEEGRRQLVGACAADSALRHAAAAELQGRLADSPEDGVAHHLLGLFALMDGRPDLTSSHFRRVLALDPLVPGVHMLLGLAALQRRDPVTAQLEFRTERSLHGPSPALDSLVRAAGGGR